MATEKQAMRSKAYTYPWYWKPKGQFEKRPGSQSASHTSRTPNEDYPQQAESIQAIIDAPDTEKGKKSISKMGLTYCPLVDDSEVIHGARGAGSGALDP